MLSFIEINEKICSPQEYGRPDTTHLGEIRTDSPFQQEKEGRPRFGAHGQNPTGPEVGHPGMSQEQGPRVPGFQEPPDSAPR